MARTTSPSDRRATAPGRRLKPAARAALAAAVLVAAVSAGTSGPGDAAAASPAPERGVQSDEVAIVELQRQVNELRGDLLDERERRIDSRQEASAAVLVVLGVLIGIGGLWTHAKFHAIAREASIGAAAARRHVLAPRGLLYETGAPRQPPGEGSAPFRILGPPSPEASPGTTTSAAGTAAVPRNGSVRTAGVPFDGLGNPTRLEDPGPDAELQRREEAIADCTAAILLDPRNPRLFVERGNARSDLGRYGEAVADYDRAIRLDPDDAAAYLGRCHAKSELGRHEEAIEDYDHAACLDPALASASGDG